MTQPTATAFPQTLPPDVQLLQMAMGVFISQATYVAAKLDIADLLAEGPKGAADLAAETSMHKRSLYRVLRALASVGIFRELDGKRFENTPQSESLRADHPNSTRDLVIWMLEPEHWNVYAGMMHSVRTGEPAWDHVHGEPVFDYLFETNKPLGEIFNRAMTSFSHQTIGPIIQAYDFSEASIIADIAGGYGHLLGAVLKANPNARGVLFEIPQVIGGAPAMLESYGVADRVELIEGNFTIDVPVRADIYMLKHIIHDWDDQKNEKILGNIRRNMPDAAKVLILDAVIPEGNEPHLGKIMDLEMLIAPGGVERSAGEFDTLLRNSGFRLTRIIPTMSPVAIIEAVKEQ